MFNFIINLLRAIKNVLTLFTSQIVINKHFKRYKRRDSCDGTTLISVIAKYINLFISIFIFKLKVWAISILNCYFVCLYGRWNNKYIVQLVSVKNIPYYFHNMCLKNYNNLFVISNRLVNF